MTYFSSTPVIPDRTDRNIDTAIIIPVFAPSDTLKVEAIITPRDIPAKLPIIDSKITSGKLLPKSALIINTKNSISSVRPTRLTKYDARSELRIIVPFLFGETDILFPLSLIFARELLIAVKPNMPPYMQAMAISV